MPISTIGKNGLLQTTDHVINGLTVGLGTGSVATNTVTGFQSLYSNTTGANNVTVGYQAMYTNTTGGYNVAIGSSALVSNTTASYNTAVGNQAVYSNTTGTNIDAVGAYVLNKNTTGVANIAMGGSGTIPALYYNTTGSYNVGLGQGALFQNTTGSYNTAVGYQAGYTLNTSGGNFNTLIGWNAGTALTTGISNTFIGASSDYPGFASGNAITTGSYNTILGPFTGNNGGLDIRTSSGYAVVSDGHGNPRIVVDGSGNVGIGTTTPSTFQGMTVLAKTSAAAETTPLSLANVSGSAGTSVSLGFAPNTNIDLIRLNAYRTDTGYGGATDLLFKFWDGSNLTEKLRVTNIGIIKNASGRPILNQSGGVLQTAYKNFSASDSISTTGITNYNSALPTSTQGTQLYSTSFTPTNSSSTLVINFTGYFYTTQVQNVIAWILEGSTTIAVAAPRYTTTGEAGFAHTVQVVKSSNGTQTYSIRFGVQNGGTAYFTTYPQYTGATQSIFTIQELAG